MYKEMSLIRFSETGDEARVTTLLSIGVDPNCKRQFLQDLPLIGAACCGHKHAVKLLLHAGADVNKADHHKYTALVYAAGYGHEDVVKTLLDAGADQTLTCQRMVEKPYH